MQPTWKPYSKIPYSLQRNGGFTLFISETEFCIVKENKILNFYKNDGLVKSHEASFIET